MFTSRRVTTYQTLDQAIELANLPGYGLSSSIYTTDPTEAFRFRAGIGAGVLSVLVYPLIAVVLHRSAPVIAAPADGS